MSQRDTFISHARSFLGAKWRHLGRTRTGIDCLGLVVVSLKAAGFEPKYDRRYGREPWKDGLREALRDHFGDPIPTEQMQEGDIALMQWDGQDDPSHVGIVAGYRYGGLSLIHSYSRTTVCEHRIDAAWRRRIIEVYRPWPL